MRWTQVWWVLWAGSLVACGGGGGAGNPVGEEGRSDDTEALEVVETELAGGDLGGDKPGLDSMPGDARVPDGGDGDLDLTSDGLAGDGLDDVASDLGQPDVCVPSCGEAVCGSDGCGGSCGECGSPKTQCLEGQCLCPEGTHDGGAGSCLLPGQCDPGFGILSGQTECKPLAEVCVGENPCEAPVSWSLGSCTFGPVADGTPCLLASPGPCATGATCQEGQCQEQWPQCTPLRPVVLVHGINGSSENFAVMRQRLIADGWPEEFLFSFDAADPKWGCNVDNASAIQALVKQAMESTCHSRVDLVAHSMGTLSSRYFIKNLGGSELVNTYVTLGGMHHGLLSSCFAPDFLGVCVWQEICKWGDFVNQLNSDPATPGPCNWVSIYSTGDDTVPAESSQLEGAENIQFEDVEHDGADGLLQVAAVYEEVKRVLQYPCW